MNFLPRVENFVLDGNYAGNLSTRLDSRPVLGANSNSSGFVGDDYVPLTP